MILFAMLMYTRLWSNYDFPKHYSSFSLWFGWFISLYCFIHSSKGSQVLRNSRVGKSRWLIGHNRNHWPCSGTNKIPVKISTVQLNMLEILKLIIGLFSVFIIYLVHWNEILCSGSLRRCCLCRITRCWQFCDTR